MILTPVAILAGALVIAGVLAWPRKGPGKAPEAPAPAPDPLRSPIVELAEMYGLLAARVVEVELKVQQLPGIWEEHADRADRAAERARKAAAARARAQREDEADGQLDALPSADAAGSGEGSMPAVHQGVGSAEQEAYLNYLAQVRRAVALAPLKGN